jgi:Ras-related protein Rab-1A
MQMWDTAGQERFRTITSSYYRGANAIVIVYDITNRGSFDNIRAWLSEIKHYARENVHIMIIGNKCDLLSGRKVQTIEAQTLADELGVKFIETSAKSSQNIDSAFMDLANDLVKYYSKSQSQTKLISKHYGSTNNIHGKPVTLLDKSTNTKNKSNDCC